MNVTQTTVNVFQELLHLLFFKSTKRLKVFLNKGQLLSFVLLCPLLQLINTLKFICPSHFF